MIDFDDVMEVIIAMIMSCVTVFALGLTYLFVVNVVFA